MGGRFRAGWYGGTRRPFLPCAAFSEGIQKLTMKRAVFCGRTKNGGKSTVNHKNGGKPGVNHKMVNFCPKIDGTAMILGGVYSNPEISESHLTGRFEILKRIGWPEETGSLAGRSRVGHPCLPTIPYGCQKPSSPYPSSSSPFRFSESFEIGSLKWKWGPQHEARTPIDTQHRRNTSGTSRVPRELDHRIAPDARGPVCTNGSGSALLCGIRLPHENAKMADFCCNNLWTKM